MQTRWIRSSIGITLLHCTDKDRSPAPQGVHTVAIGVSLQRIHQRQDVAVTTIERVFEVWGDGENGGRVGERRVGVIGKVEIITVC